LLGSVSVEALTQRPYEGGWTALECAEHLVLAEQSLLRIIREMLDRPADAALSLRLQGRDGAVVTAMGDRSRKLKTFDFLEPKGMYPTTHAVLDAFLARRADTLDFVRCVKEPVHHHAMPLEGLGLLDAYQWLLLIAAHTDRHTEQMREAAG
jgi:hypothetical protein